MANNPMASTETEIGRLAASLAPKERFVLLLAADCDADTLRHAADDISDIDWPVAVALLSHHFLGAVALSKLRSAVSGPRWTDRLAVLDRQKARQVLRGMLMQKTLRGLHDDHIAGLNSNWAIMKGLALGARYYGDPLLRVTRDIDILVGDGDLRRLLASMVSGGYKLLEEPETGLMQDRRVEMATAMADISSEIALLSPQGILVEVHRKIDLAGHSFATADLLQRTEEVEFAGRAWPALATSDLFPYIAYHHARHQWSRLHWLLDAAMIRRHPSFDETAVLDRAQSAGLRTATEAAMHLPDAVLSVVKGKTVAPCPPLTAQFVRDCLTYCDPNRNLPPEQARRKAQGLEPLRLSLRRTRRELALRDASASKASALIHGLGPRNADYHALPLPRGMRWLYWPMRPVRLLLVRTGFLRKTQP